MNIISNNAERKEQSFHCKMTLVITLFVFYRSFSANSMGGSDIKIEPKAQKFVNFDAFLEYCSSSEWKCVFKFKFYGHSMNS